MAVVDDPLMGLGYSAAAATRPFTRLGGERTEASNAPIAEEVPLALVYNGRSHVVVMGTPSDLEDLAYGFSLTESIVSDPGRIERVEIVKANHGIELQIQIPSDDAERLDDRTRGLVARTGCGLCGVETINEALRVPVQVSHGLRIGEESLWLAGGELSKRQSLNNATNAVHGAAWTSGDDVSRQGFIVREDVGRHNALDKVFGALARAGSSPAEGFIVVTSRASYEMVQKTATCGVELIAAISRPTGLAIRFAQAAGVTLVGLLRGRTANVYSHPERIVSQASPRS